MSTISKSWSSETVIYETNLYGGSDADVTTLVYTDNVDLETNGYEGCQVQIKFDADNATDTLAVAIYASLTSSHDTDEIAINQFNLTNDGTEMIWTFIVKDLAHFYIGLARSGTSTTFDVEVSYKAWRWTVV